MLLRLRFLPNLPTNSSSSNQISTTSPFYHQILTAHLPILFPSPPDSYGAAHPSSSPPGGVGARPPPSRPTCSPPLLMAACSSRACMPMPARKLLPFPIAFQLMLALLPLLHASAGTRPSSLSQQQQCSRCGVAAWPALAPNDSGTMRHAYTGEMGRSGRHGTAWLRLSRAVPGPRGQPVG